MQKVVVLSVVAALVLMAAGVGNAQQRDTINMVGSSTVYPFSALVAERFGKSGDFKTPKVESTGTGGGFKLFCGGIGVQHPDIANASRAIKASEFEACTSNGVSEIVEVKIGYDGIVLANSRQAPEMTLTTAEIFLALAREIPDPKGGAHLVPNPYRNWKEINAALPDMKIEVLGPPPTSGTRDAFLELAMETGALTFESLKKLSKEDSKKFKVVFSAIREDGAYVDAGENDNLIVQKLLANPNSLGIFGFSYLDQNTDKLKGALVANNPPTFENIANGKYPLSRALFIYVKKAHIGVIPGIKAFLDEFTSEKAWGEEGYLSEKGLIPLPEAERKQVAERVKSLQTLRDVK
jgi:phosphate transport system substrate-binding protein